MNIAFIPLSSGYILIPHEPIEVDALCESGQQKIKIQGSTKIASRDKCILSGLNIVLKLSSTEYLVGEIKYKKNLFLPYTNEQLVFITVLRLRCDRNYLNFCGLQMRYR